MRAFDLFFCSFDDSRAHPIIHSLPASGLDLCFPTPYLLPYLLTTTVINNDDNNNWCRRCKRSRFWPNESCKPRPSLKSNSRKRRRPPETPQQRAENSRRRPPRPQQHRRTRSGPLPAGGSRTAPAVIAAAAACPLLARLLLGVAAAVGEATRSSTLQQSALPAVASVVRSPDHPPHPFLSALALIFKGQLPTA